MYNLGIFLVILQLGILKLTSGTNYCDPKLCTSNGVVLHHIGCKHSGQFASNCVEPAKILVTPSLKKIILHEHNDLRNKVANGSLPGFQSAKRMTTLTWDSELEYLAELNVLQCEMAHDDCHNTIAYKYSGQNIGVQHQTDSLYPAEYESLIIYLIHEWFNEYKFANQSDTDMCLRIDRENEVGHFTAMVQERTSKVGCGISRYVKFLQGENWDTILFACNYSYCNMVGLPIYIKGTEASACQTGPNPEFNGLCSLSENVPPIPESEEETPLPPVFTTPNLLMKPVTSTELVHPVRSNQANQTPTALSRTIPSVQVERPISSVKAVQPVPSTQIVRPNYCDPTLCTTNDYIAPHIGCNNNGTFANNCIEPSEIPITSHLRQLILHMHNDLRNKVANGSLPGFEMAKRMATVTWDSELQFLAGLNVRQCEMIHDACHNTVAYKYSGQNLAIQHRTDPILPAEYESLVIFLIHEWFNEYRYAKQSEIDTCVRRDHGNEIGHFTALVQEKTSKVGCSIAKYITFMQDKNWDTILMACDYSFGNLIGLPIYEKGIMTSACQTGANPEFNGLCSVFENIRPVPESDEEPSARPRLSGLPATSTQPQLFVTLAPVPLVPKSEIEPPVLSIPSNQNQSAALGSLAKAGLRAPYVPDIQNVSSTQVEQPVASNPILPVLQSVNGTPAEVVFPVPSVKTDPSVKSVPTLQPTNSTQIGLTVPKSEIEPPVLYIPSNQNQSAALGSLAKAGLRALSVPDIQNVSSTQVEQPVTSNPILPVLQSVNGTPAEVVFPVPSVKTDPSVKSVPTLQPTTSTQIGLTVPKSEIEPPVLSIPSNQNQSAALGSPAKVGLHAPSVPDIQNVSSTQVEQPVTSNPILPVLQSVNGTPAEVVFPVPSAETDPSVKSVPTLQPTTSTQIGLTVPKSEIKLPVLSVPSNQNQSAALGSLAKAGLRALSVPDIQNVSLTQVEGPVVVASSPILPVLQSVNGTPAEVVFPVPSAETDLSVTSVYTLQPTTSAQIGLTIPKTEMESPVLSVPSNQNQSATLVFPEPVARGSILPVLQSVNGTPAEVAFPVPSAKADLPVTLVPTAQIGLTVPKSEDEPPVPSVSSNQNQSVGLVPPAQAGLRALSVPGIQNVPSTQLQRSFASDPILSVFYLVNETSSEVVLVNETSTEADLPVSSTPVFHPTPSTQVELTVRQPSEMKPPALQHPSTQDKTFGPVRPMRVRRMSGSAPSTYLDRSVSSNKDEARESLPLNFNQSAKESPVPSIPSKQKQSFESVRPVRRGILKSLYRQPKPESNEEPRCVPQSSRLLQPVRTSRLMKLISKAKTILRPFRSRSSTCYIDSGSSSRYTGSSRPSCSIDSLICSTGSRSTVCPIDSWSSTCSISSVSSPSSHATCTIGSWPSTYSIVSSSSSGSIDSTSSTCSNLPNYALSSSRARASCTFVTLYAICSRIERNGRKYTVKSPWAVKANITISEPYTHG